MEVVEMVAVQAATAGEESKFPGSRMDTGVDKVVEGEMEGEVWVMVGLAEEAMDEDVMAEKGSEEVDTGEADTVAGVEGMEVVAMAGETQAEEVVMVVVESMFLVRYMCQVEG
eukprot:gene11310-13365_t